MRLREQHQHNHRRTTYQLTFPAKVGAEQVTACLNAVRQNLGPERWGMVAAAMAFELIHREGGIQHRLRVPGGSKGDQIYNQLEGHIPGLHIERLDEPAYPKWLVAGEYGTTNHRARLGIPDMAALSNTLLHSGQNLYPGEATMIQVVACAAAHERVPTPPKQVVRVRGSILGSLTDLITGDPRHDIEEHKAKLGEPNFLAVVRIAATAKNEKRAQELVTALSRAMGSANGRARFRRLTRPGDAVERVNRAAVPTLKFPAQLMLSEVAALTFPINAQDVAGLKKPPTRHMRADPSIPTKGIILGRSTRDVQGKPRWMAVDPMDAMTHVLLLGKTGTGKSTLFQNAAHDIVRRTWTDPSGTVHPMGLMLLDPHGDLTAAVLNDLPRERLQDVIYIDPTDPVPVGMNLLSGTSPSLITSSMMGVLEKLYGTGVLTSHVLRNTITTVAMHKGMTLYEVALALDDPEFREEITHGLKDERLKGYWTRFTNLSRSEQTQSTEPVMRRLGAFLTPEFKGIFGQSGGLDMQAATMQGKIILLNMSQGKLGDKDADLLGAMATALAWSAIKERANIPEEWRPPFYLLADEAPRFMKFSTSLGDMLGEARKFRLSCWLATQSIGQIQEIKNDVTVNTRLKIIWESGNADAGIISREIGVEAEDIQRLPEHTAILSLPHTPPATMQTLPPPKPVGLAGEAVAASRANYGKPMEDVELEIASRRTTKIGPKRERPKLGKED